MKPTHGEVLAVVHGDPGTGKSHLIHWLKLRSEDALKRQELKDLVPVLIQRRSGSLKDALEQMINQLPLEFSHYLDPVKEALSKISDTTAREMLSAGLFLELGSRRADRNRMPITGDLRNLREVCVSTGFRQWLCRNGGVIDLSIRRLTQESDIADREEPPQFTESEFNITDARYKRENTKEVRDLIDDFIEESSLREQAAEYLNEVLSDAIREMTGLSGTRLRDIFDQIRIDLKNQGKGLALFIEDVSLMSALNEEVFIAVEPQRRPDLCHLVAVLGATPQGWNRLPDNQKERVTHPVSVGGSLIEEWRREPNAVAEFAGRYLNTTRLSADEVSAVAQQRREGGDVNISACDNCLVRDDCHATFGKVVIGTVEIGMFPFSPIAPQRLLLSLQEHAAVHKNPRGLLTRILLPVLDDGFDYLDSKRFPPSKKIAVSMPELLYWTGFERRYCGGWSMDDKARLKFLAQAWIETADADEAGANLKPFLEPFGFRQFTHEVVVTETPVPRPPTLMPPQQPLENAKLAEVLHNLERWMDGDLLVGDQEIRQLLAELIRRSIPWDNFSFPPLEAWKTLIGDASRYQFVRIEGMHALPGGIKFFIDFPRSKETRDLIEALAQFRYAGNRSWSFPHSEVHKRTIARWVRQHGDRIVRELQPRGGLDPALPISSAIQLLALNAVVRRRGKLPVEPQEAPELIRLLLMDQDGNPSEGLSKEWRQLLEDVRVRHPNVKKFLLTELDIPQGRGARGVNFINPLLAIKIAASFIGEPKVVSLTPDFHRDFWQGRYEALARLEQYDRLSEALEKERTAISEVIDSIAWSLRASGFTTDDLPAELSEYCSEIAVIMSAQKAADLSLPDPDFDDLKSRKLFSERKDVWATAIRQAQDVITSDDLTEVMTFDSRALKEARDSLAVTVQYLSRLETLVGEILLHIEQEGDPDVLSLSILQTLDEIASKSDGASEP